MRCGNLGMKAALVTLLLVQELAGAFAFSPPSAESNQTLELFNQGRIAEAAKLQTTVLEKEPSNWFARSVMACVMWKQANVAEALKEGDIAAKLAPDNALVLINLGLMKQSFEDFDQAIDCYRKAIQVDPNNFVPHLGIARSFILKGDEKKGVKLLTEMIEKRDAGFDWYYSAGQTCLKANQTKLAERAMRKAMPYANGTKQLAATNEALFLIYLRSNRIDLARNIWSETFGQDAPRRAETYVRAAAILSPSELDKGTTLLKLASENLSAQNSMAFLQMGRSFEEKASQSQSNATQVSTGQGPRAVAWIDVAQEAYRRAVSLAPKETGYHLALANALLESNKGEEAINELKATQFSCPADPLLAFLVKHGVPNDTARGAAPKLESLSKASLSITGLSCDCHSSKLAGVIRNIDGVALVTLTGQKVFDCSVVYAPPVVSIESIISNTKVEFLKQLPPKPGEKPLSIDLRSESKFGGTKELLAYYCQNRYGSILSFSEPFVQYYNRFNDIQPALPSTIATGTSWSTPLY